MRTSLLLAAMMAMAANVAMAGKISQERALQIAREFVGDTGQGQPRSINAATLTLAASTDGYYAFNRAGNAGFVIVCADDAAANSVLGYADQGSFNAGNMPPALAWMLEQYGRELSAATPLTTLQGAQRTATERTNISPMLTTLWGQDEPFNAMCPQYGGEVCPTGCVATAYAQLMYYHKWPTTGTGSHQYNWTVNDVYQGTLSANFSQSTYDWDAMQDSYLDGYNDNASSAVAKLMSDLGVAFEMVYYPQSSGTTDYTATTAMTKYFGYAKDLQLLQRNYYGTNEWADMIYAELAQGRPIYYVGTSGAGGHAFILDGYRDGYFHVNWGWDGGSNGYFVLTALDPASQGTGGSNAGFNYDQMAVFGLRPDNGATDYKTTMYCNDAFATSTSTATVYSSATFTGGFYNYSLDTRNVTLGIMVVSQQADTTYIEASGCTADLPSLYGWTSYAVSMYGFPTENGTYIIYPAYRDNTTNQWQQMRSPISATSHSVSARVNNGVIYLTTQSTNQATQLGVTSVEAITTPYAGQYFQAKATVTNNGNSEFYDDLWVPVVASGSYNVASASGYEHVSIMPGETKEIIFETLAPSEAGNYQMVLAWDSNIISGRYNITVENVPSNTLSLSLDGPLTITHTPETADNTLSLTATINCTSGTYNGTLMAEVFPYEGGYSRASYVTDLYIAGGDSATVNFSGTFETGAVGDRYFIRVYYISDNQYVALPSSANNNAVFTYLQSTAISGATAATLPRDIEIYTLTGKLVQRQTATEPNLSVLGKGIYIVKDGNTVRKVVRK